MKSLRFLFALLGIAASLHMPAQESQDYNHGQPQLSKWPRIFKISLGEMLLGPIPPYITAYGLIYESAVANKQALQAGISFVGKGLPILLLEQSGALPASVIEKGIELQFAYKFYMTDKSHCASKGWYLAPLFHFTTAQLGLAYATQIQSHYLELELFDANIIWGCQLMRRSGRGLVVDFFTGGGYKNFVAVQHLGPATSEPYAGFTRLYTSPLNLLAGLTIGWGSCQKEKQSIPSE